MPVLIASGASVLNSYDLEDAGRQAFVMPDGRIVLWYFAGGALQVVASADGMTWTAPVTITGSSSTTTIALRGTTFWLVHDDGSVGAATYAAGAVTSAGLAPCSAALGAFRSHVGDVELIAAAWDGASGDDLYGVLNPLSGAVLFHIGASSPSRVDSVVSGPSAMAPFLVVADLAILPGATDTVFTVYFPATTNGGIYVYPALYPGGSSSAQSFQTSSPEFVAGGTVHAAGCAVDGSGHLDVVWIDHAGNVYASTRTGTGVYTAPVNIARQANSTSIVLSLATDTGGVLHVFYTSVANVSTGELYVVSRQGGSWQTPVLVAGGGGIGYHAPKSTAIATSGRVDLLYQAGPDVYYQAIDAASAPAAPVLTVSPLTSLVPTIAGPYQNPASPGDLQGGREIRLTRNADSHVMWDSGMMAAQTSTVYGLGSATGDSAYVAPAALSYDVPYTVTARDQDSSLPTLIGPWSSGTIVTLRQGGTVTITQLVDDGVTDSSSPATIGAAVIDAITASWAQPNGHGAAQYQDTLYDAAMTDVVAQTPATTIPGGLASGSSFTSGPWPISGLTNGTTYQLVRAYLDATSGVWSQSAPWIIDTSWAPPPAPSAFLALVIQHPGYIVLAWINPAEAVRVLLERSLSGSDDWVTLYAGGLIDTGTDMTPLNTEVGWDFRVSITDSRGIQSAYATQTGVTIGADGIFGQILVDSTDTAVWAHLGVLADWKQGTAFTEANDSQITRPFGASKAIISDRFLDDSEARQREVEIPPDGPYFAGGALFSQMTCRQTLRAMRTAGNAVYYRDIGGEAMYVRIMNVERSVAQDGWPMLRLQFDMSEVDGPGGPANSNMPFFLPGVMGPSVPGEPGDFVPGVSRPGG